MSYLDDFIDASRKVGQAISTVAGGAAIVGGMAYGAKKATDAVVWVFSSEDEDEKPKRNKKRKKKKKNTSAEAKPKKRKKRRAA